MDNCDCVLVGCTDETALNYDETATDDCSCIYENNCSSISMITGSYTTEVSWNIEDSNGNIVLSGGPHMNVELLFNTDAIQLI